MKKKLTTREQVIEALSGFLVGDDKSPRILNKVDCVAGNSSSFEITFNEGKGFFTNFHVTISEPELFEIEEDDES